MSENLIADVLKQENKDAILLLQAGKYEEALVVFRRSYETEKELKLDSHAARTQVNIANTLYLMKNYDNAVVEMEQACEYFSGNKEWQAYFDGRIFVARILLIQRKLDEAEKMADEVIRKCKDDSYKGMAYLFLYQIRMLKQQKSKILESVNKAVTCFERKKDIGNLVIALSARAEYYVANHRSDLAMMDKIRCRELREKEAN